MERDRIQITLGNLYIGKSKINLISLNEVVPNDELVKIWMCPYCPYNHTADKLLDKYLPHFRVSGNFTPPNTFTIHIENRPYTLWLTQTNPKIPLDLYRLKGCVWSSYYEEERKGYLWQITPNVDLPELLTH